MRKFSKKLSKEQKKIAFAFVIASLMTLVAASGLLYRIDRFWRDTVIESLRIPDERIVVIGIDAYSISEIGEWPWDRSVMAELLDTINQDEDSKPAAIGLDILYAAETDEEADEALAEAAGAYDNVVAACAVEYGSEVIVLADGTSYLDEFVAKYPTLPYEALRENVELGHINAMYDKDGILRRHLWEVEMNNGQTFSSMPEQLYKMYCEHHGLTADFTPMTNERGFWWVDFSGNPGDYFAYSVADILNGEYDQDILKDAIVLIGPYEASMSDEFITAANHAKKMYGVEYLANVTANVLSGQVKREVSDGLQLFVLFFYTGILLYLQIDNKMKSMILGFLSVFVTSAVLDQIAYHFYGWVIHSFWFCSAIGVVLAICLYIRYSTAQKERLNITKTFERYVDPAIMTELLKGDADALGMSGKTMKIAILFVDIRGFTNMSEKMPPERVVMILNRYLTLTSECIKRNGGTLDKFMGDCTMAFWGAPLPCEDPVYHACKAGWEMQQRANQIKAFLAEKYSKSVDFGIGIHYGEAVVGNIGSPDRMDYTAIGDTVNTASRLESNAPAGCIYISREVADQLGSRARVTSLGDSVKLKGKTEGFEVLKLDHLD